MMGFGKAGFALPPDELRAYKRDIGGDPFPWHKGKKPLGFVPEDVRFNTEYQIAKFTGEDMCGPDFVSPSWQNTQIPKTGIPEWVVQTAAGQAGRMSFVVEQDSVEVESPREWSILGELIDDKPKPQPSPNPNQDRTATFSTRRGCTRHTRRARHPTPDLTPNPKPLRLRLRLTLNP